VVTRQLKVERRTVSSPAKDRRSANCATQPTKLYYKLVSFCTLIVRSRTGRAGRHGYAYTFISQSQGKYAGEIIKALELSSAPVAAELTQLWEKYKQEAEAVMCN